MFVSDFWLKGNWIPKSDIGRGVHSPDTVGAVSVHARHIIPAAGACARPMCTLYINIIEKLLRIHFMHIN